MYKTSYFRIKDARLLTEAFRVDNVYIANKEGKPKAELEYDYRVRNFANYTTKNKKKK